MKEKGEKERKEKEKRGEKENEKERERAREKRKKNEIITVIVLFGPFLFLGSTHKQNVLRSFNYTENMTGRR